MIDSPSHSAPVILVTGCSSGIGLALARKLWDSQFRVVITARKQSLTKIANEPFCETERFLVRPFDLTSYSEHHYLVKEIQERWGGVDILVNNAGIAYRSVVEEMDSASELNQLLVNYLAPMNLTRLVLPSMRAKRSGRIINVSSVSGMMAMPTMGSYSASKWALEGASESLWYEGRPWGIHVSLIEPGFIRSNSFQKVIFTPKSKEEQSPYSKYYSNMGSFIEKLMNWSISTPEDIADIIIKTAQHPAPKLRVQATLDARLFFIVRRLLPRRPYHYLLYRSLPGIKGWISEK